LYSSEGNKDEERLRFLQHLVIKQKEAARDEDYLAKYHDESMLGLNQGGLTLVSKLALSWATNMLQTVRKSFTMETMRVQNKDALNVAMKNLPSSGMESLSWQEADHIREQLTLKVYHCWAGMVVKGYKLKFAGRLYKKAQDTAFRTRLKVEEKWNRKGNKTEASNLKQAGATDNVASKDNVNNQCYNPAEDDVFWNGLCESEWPDSQEIPGDTNNSETTGEWTGEQQAQEKESLRSTRLVNKTIGGDKMEVESKSETSNVSTPA
jgi:hypothetical protein